MLDVGGVQGGTYAVLPGRSISRGALTLTRCWLYKE